MRNSFVAQCLRTSARPWTLLSATHAFAATSSSFSSPTSITNPTRLYSSLYTGCPISSSSSSDRCSSVTTAGALRAALLTSASKSHHNTKMTCGSLNQTMRWASDDATSSTAAESADAAATTATTTTSSDPVSMSASPRYTSHAEAEKVAYQQEDNVQHRDFGDHSCSSSGSGDGHCGCGHSTDATTATTAKPVHGRRDFSTVFHQEVAAWRATHKHNQTGGNGSAGPAGEAPHAGADSSSPHVGGGDAPSLAAGGGADAHLRDSHRTHLNVHPEDVPPGMTYEAYVAHLQAEEEMQRFLAQNTMHSIRRSMARDNAAAEAEAVLTTNSTMRTRLEPHQGYRGVQTLLDYNKQWAAEVSRFNPRYFIELAKEQKPEYLWIGCSDSRVPANEVIGLHPGDVFVHRNIGNIFSLSDLNCLSALQFAVDCLKVQHVIIAGHYKCGGVTAAMRGDNLGLTDHWIMQVADIKNKWWDRVTADIPEEFHLNVLCELNVLEQLSHVVNCRIVQRRWKSQNANDRYYGRTTNSVYVRPEYATKHLSEKKIRSNLPTTVVNYEEELEVHGWVYSLDDGMLRPLLSLTRHSNVKKEIAQAIEALFIRYSQML